MEDEGWYRNLAKTAQSLLRPFVPLRVRKKISQLIRHSINRSLYNKSPKEKFSTIYKKKMWGGGESFDFFSGPGSHRPEIVDPYIKAVSKFLMALPQKPDVVDLGCGDFSVGSGLRGFCARYIACDVVPELIERNKKLYGDLQVEFDCLDMTEEALPVGDIVFIRQVFQHLSNRQILKVLEKLSQYTYLILSEYLPKKNFIANREMLPGVDTRVEHDSGVVITSPPFNFLPKAHNVICNIPVNNGIICTTVYQLN